MPLYLMWSIIMFCITVGYIHCNRLPDEQRLLLKLFDNYDTSVRPVYNSSKNVAVTFGFTLIQIMDMDEKNQVLITNAWLVMEWKDERIGWNQSEFGDMSIVRIPARLLWLPDIVLYNNWWSVPDETSLVVVCGFLLTEDIMKLSYMRKGLLTPRICADDYTTGFMNVNAMVHNDGNVFWSPPVRLRSSCKVDITYFPFDTQICKLKFGSWTYDKAQVDLINQADLVDVSSYVTNGEWRLSRFKIVREETVYPIGDAVYPDVTVVLVIRRRVLYYVLNIIAPCFWLNILSVLNFALPPDAGEKMTLGITVLLSYSVFMLLVADSMPPTSEFVPLIGIYLTVSMAMSSVSVVLSVMVMKLHHCVPNQREVPPWVRRFVLKGLSSFLRCRCKPTCRYSRRRRINMKPSAAAAERLAAPTEMCTKLMNEVSVSTHPKSYRRDIGMLSDIRTEFSSTRAQNPFAGDNGSDLPEHDRRSFFSEEALKYLRLLVAKSDEEDNQTAVMDEWKQVALVIDKLLFWSFLFITISTVVGILVIIPMLVTDDDGTGL